eukprot:XP_001705462.1 Hypothetical protein GL50803_31596 [Giardia lamblia ATCC 50803]
MSSVLSCFSLQRRTCATGRVAWPSILPRRRKLEISSATSSTAAILKLLTVHEPQPTGCTARFLNAMSTIDPMTTRNKSSELSRAQGLLANVDKNRIHITLSF